MIKNLSTFIIAEIGNQQFTQSIEGTYINMQNGTILQHFCYIAEIANQQLTQSMEGT